MGLFSSSKKTVVGSSAFHTMDVYNLGNPAGDVVVETVLTSGVPVASLQDLPGRLIDSNMNGFSIKVNRAYEYARDHYTLGLPTGAHMAIPVITNESIAPYILTDTGYPYSVLVTDHEYAPFTPMLAVAEFLKNTREYDPVTGTIGVWPPGTVFTSPYGDNISGLPKKVEIDTVAVKEDNITALVTYRKYIYRGIVIYAREDPDDIFSPMIRTISNEWIDNGTVTEDVLIPGATAATQWGGDCLVALYQQIASDGALLPTVYSWIYHLDTHLYPVLHPDVDQDISTSMPVIPVRYQNQDLSQPNGTELYDTSKKLLSLLGHNLGSMGTQLNKNPGISDIDHAYLLFGVNVQSDFVPSLYYLNHHFYQLAQNQRGTETSFLAALADPDVVDEPYNTYVFNPLARAHRDKPRTLTEYGLSLDIIYDYINVDIEDKIIGDVGHTIKSIRQYSGSIQNTHYVMGSPTTYTWNYTRYMLVLESQINDYQTRTVYVHNLRTVNWVYRDYAVITSLKNILEDPDNNGLIIPIQYQLSQLVFGSKISVLNSFYTDSMMMIVQSIDRIKVKWYQKGWFKGLIMIVAIVIAAWTGQAYLANMALLLTGAASVTIAGITMAGILGAIAYMAVGVLISLTLSYVVTYAVRKYGAKLGVFGAILLTAAAMVASKGFGMLGTASDFMMSATQYMLQTSSALISSANEFLVEQAAGIVSEFTAFTEKMAGLWEELEELTDLLQWKADLDPLTFTKPERLKIMPNETPTVFFSRCLGLVDNTMFGIHDEIPNFMDMRLRHTKDISPELYGLNSYT